MTASAGQRVGMGLFFYPRGGSAQVVRYLSAALAGHGWVTDLATGSLGGPGDSTHAATFFARGDLVAGDYTNAARLYNQGHDPMVAPLPHHPSYEDRKDVADAVFATLDDAAAAHQVDAWADLLAGSAWRHDSVLHLHHLTPLHAAAERCFPDTPIVTHLHGTELKFIAQAVHDPPPGWEHGPAWVERFRHAAQRSAHIICVSRQDRALAADLLGVDTESISVVANGVDTNLFDRQSLDLEARLSHWRHWLIDDPQGWDESGEPGTINYTEADLAPFSDGGQPAPVLLYVGRFLAFKRVAQLIRAYGAARAERGLRAPLVIWGGSPGEWEGEHPYTVARDEGINGVFFVGWRGHEELPTGLACSDVLVAPSVDEPFGQVYLEAMACGLPVIATATGGPLSFVNTHTGQPNGWLIAPDNDRALTAVLADAAQDADETGRRGDRAYHQIRAAYSWDALAEEFIAIYRQVT